MSGSFSISRNALVAHKLTQLRQEQLRREQLHPETLTCGNYRHLMHQISLLIAYEATLSLQPANAVTFKMRGSQASGSALGIDPVIVPILRSGLIMAEAFQEIMPQTLTGHIGLHKDKTNPHEKPLQYLVSLPDLTDRLVILLDPVIATGDTACSAIEIVKNLSPQSIIFASLVISQPARDRFIREGHNDVNFYCASVDEYVNDAGEVLPGLGSVSEHLFGFRTQP